jgi:hypothetical protein
MGVPRMQPSGRIDVTSHNKMEGRLSCYGFGEDDRAINPGDLLIVGTQWMRENSKLLETEFVLSLRGRDMAYFLDHAKHAQDLWADNKHWLTAPMSNPGDTRPLSVQRSESQQDAVRAFYERSKSI